MRRPKLTAFVDAHLRGCLPPGVPPSYSEIVDVQERTEDRHRIVEATVVMFDGERAMVRLMKHRGAARGFWESIWSHRWLMDRAVYWEDGAWHRDDVQGVAPPKDGRYHAAGGAA